MNTKESITAEYARKLAAKTRHKNLPKVIQAIEKAALKGDLKTFYYQLLSDEEVLKLKIWGFDVNQGTDRDGVLVTIDWAEKETIYPETPVDKPINGNI